MNTRQNVEFQSEGATLRGWLYTQERPSPTIVMTHGYSAVKEQYLDRYAQVFAEHGFAVLAYDHANFGDSDGSPRQEVDPWLQIRGYRDAITFAQTLDFVDSERIGIWGTSYSGGHVLTCAAIDRRVGCVVSQVPTISGFQASLRRTAPDRIDESQASFNADRASRYAGGQPQTLPAVSDGTSKAALPGADAYEFFTETVEFSPNWQNSVTLRSTKMSKDYEPGMYISRISL